MQCRGRQNWDIYAQRVDSGGRLSWSDTGLAVCRDTNNASSPRAVSDGGGGAIIAWFDDRGLYAQRVADGVGVVEESYKPQASSHMLAATFARGVLFLAEATSRKPQAASLMDAAGQKAMNLHAGANDVRVLAPGVYFVLEEPRASSPKPQAVRKVILTE